MNTLLDKVKQAIEKHDLLQPGDGIVVGVSGGADSVCLLHVLHQLQEEWHLSLYPVHVNHMLRGEESMGDEAYVQQLCQDMHLLLQVFRIDIAAAAEQQGLSLEEAGRDARYAVFQSAAEKAGAQRIAVAHHRNDVAETVLMNLLRGSGLDGLKGMDWKRGSIIRPLLETERSEIEAYCTFHQLQSRIDSSNKLSIYTRNKIRLDVIPFIDQTMGSHLVRSLSRMAGLVREDIEFLEAETQKAYQRCTRSQENAEVELKLDVLAALHRSLQRRVLRMAVEQVKGNLKGIESVHVEQVLMLGAIGRTGAELHLPGNVRVSKSYDTLKICLQYRQQLAGEFGMIIAVPGKTYVEKKNAFIQAQFVEGLQNKLPTVSQKSLVQFFDYDKLAMGISIRNRRQGDIFQPFGFAGTKKLKEFFIDEKIPREQRDHIPLLALDEEIVWVIGYRTGERFRVGAHTKKILRLEYIPDSIDNGRETMENI